MSSSTGSLRLKRELSPDEITPAEPIPKQPKISHSAQEYTVSISNTSGGDSREQHPGLKQPAEPIPDEQHGSQAPKNTGLPPLAVSRANVQARDPGLPVPKERFSMNQEKSDRAQGTEGKTSAVPPSAAPSRNIRETDPSKALPADPVEEGQPEAQRRQDIESAVANLRRLRPAFQAVVQRGEQQISSQQNRSSVHISNAEGTPQESETRPRLETSANPTTAATAVPTRQAESTRAPTITAGPNDARRRPLQPDSPARIHAHQPPPLQLGQPTQISAHPPPPLRPQHPAQAAQYGSLLLQPAHPPHYRVPALHPGPEWFTAYLPAPVPTERQQRIDAIMARLPRDNAQYTNVLSGTYFSSVADHHWQLIAPRFGGILPPYIEYDLHTLLVPGETELIRRRVMNLGLFIPVLDPSLQMIPYPWVPALQDLGNAVPYGLLIQEYFRAQIFYYYQLRTLRTEVDRQFAIDWWWRHAPARQSVFDVPLPTPSADFERYVRTLREQVREVGENGAPVPNWVLTHFVGEFRGLGWWELPRGFGP